MHADQQLRQFAIFILSLPMLAFAILWFLVGIIYDIIAAPFWIPFGLIYMLRGESGNWGIFLVAPLMMFSMYSELTGLIPDPLDWPRKVQP